MIEEFHYTIPWRASSPHPGGHPSLQLGGGDEFAGLLPFASCPNPRHLDIRASLSDPFDQLTVRSFRQRSNIPVIVLADLSASIGFQGAADKAELLARFSASVAWSAYRHGDRFGFFGGDQTLREELLIPPRYYKGGVPELYERLLRFPRTGCGSDGLMAAAHWLGKQRSLVFLISDFHFSLEGLDALMAGLTRHDVVPVVLWDSGEYERLPDWGLALVEDPETGQRRRLFMRPALKARLARRYAERREELAERFRRQGRSPFYVIDRFDADALTRYFLSVAEDATRSRPIGT